MQNGVQRGLLWIGSKENKKIGKKKYKEVLKKSLGSALMYKKKNHKFPYSSQSLLLVWYDKCSILFILFPCRRLIQRKIVPLFSIFTRGGSEKKRECNGRFEQYCTSSTLCCISSHVGSQCRTHILTETGDFLSSFSFYFGSLVSARVRVSSGPDKVIHNEQTGCPINDF